MGQRELLEEYARRKRAREGTAALLAAIRVEFFDKQEAFVADPSRNKLALCTRRAGKTNIWPRYTTSECIEHPGVLIRIWAVNRLRAKQLLWDEFTALFRRHGIEVIHTGFPSGNQVKLHETELTIRFGNGSEIRLLGADKDKEAQKKRGDKTWMEVIIESQLFGPYLQKLVEEVAGPCLFDLRGTFCMEGTPGPICTGYWYESSGRNDIEPRFISVGGEKGVGAGWSCHRWSVLDNPHLPHAREEIAALKKRNRWDDNHPTYIREYTARWVNDIGALFYKYNETRNSFDPEALQPWGPGWNHVLGWDLGFRDSMALVVWGWHPAYPDVYEAFSWKWSPSDENPTNDGSISDQVMSQITALENKGFNFVAKVADTGGGGKMFVEEVMTRHSQHFEAAQKTQKAEHVRLMNDDFLTGKIKTQRGSALTGEISVLPKDPNWDPLSGVAPLEDPRFENHCADAALYSWRRAYHFLFEAEPPRKTRAERQEDEDVKRLERPRGEKPWWEATDDWSPECDADLDG